MIDTKPMGQKRIPLAGSILERRMMNNYQNDKCPNTLKQVSKMLLV